MRGFSIRAALRVAWKDIKILLRERGRVLLLFVVPIVFIVGFSSGLGGGSDPQHQSITLPVVNLDAGSAPSQTLLEALDQGGGIQCAPFDEAKATDWLENGKIDRVLTIPANYGADLEAGRHVTLRLVNSPDANATTTEAVHRVVAGVTADLSLETQLISSFRQMAAMQASTAPDEQAFTA